ncbi:hypothetical protein CK203_053382 [Vitis vinifera]|uniref:Uncharacterized protein n=1 Tax=Vitis vinifera TaxID=29760 RepID=A0A438GZN0_VITVI|nr:hypothetical protein CK203_053382 [Vitis vinifera]
MEETKIMKTPMSSSIKLDKDEGKHPAEPSQPPQSEVRRKARFDITLFNSMEDYQRYKQKFAQRKVVPGRTFYSRATYGIGGSIVSTVRGVEIRLDQESICRIFDIAPIGPRVRLRDGQTIGPQLDYDQ